MVTGSAIKQKHKVLIVDDETLNIEFLQTLLSEDINVIFATSGEDALAIVQANRPAMILLDIMMPGMDGYEVCKRLKSNPETKDIPVIFVTAKEGPQEEARGLELGAIDYITKPFNPEIVKSKVRNHIVGIATPRPDLEMHHNKERHGERGKRLALDVSSLPRWIAAGAALLALALVVVYVVPRDTPGLSVLWELAGNSSASEDEGAKHQQTAAEKAGRQSAASPSGSVANAPAPTTRTATNRANSAAAMDMRWVEDSKCPLVPEVAWWSFNSHVSIVRYVQRNLKGNWTAYTEKWEKRLKGILDIYARNSTAITNTGVELSGADLLEYVEQMKQRVEAIKCLGAEAVAQGGK